MRKKRASTGTTRGFAIILVLATLVLLAMLSLTYIKLALIDRNIARNYMDNKRAKLIAQSGVEYGLARIQEDPFGTGWQNLLNKTITINGKAEKYTESAGSTYGQDRDIFAVQVKDSNSMISVNDGVGNDRVKENTKRMLNVLGDVVGIDQAKIGGKLGDVIIDKRPASGYASMQAILRAINNELNEFNKFKDFITIYAWQDEVANPVPLSADVKDAYLPEYTAKGIYRYGRGKDYGGNSIGTIGGVDYSQLRFADESSTFAAPNSFRHAIYGLDELNPQWIEIVSRSPVNINTAPRNVLIALLKDLRGFFASDRRNDSPDYHSLYALLFISDDVSYIKGFDYSPATYTPYTPFGSDELGFLYTTMQIGQPLAENIADQIITNRNFKTWRQFNTFCDNLVGDGKLLNDTRSIFYEYNLNPNSSTLVSSKVAGRQASQAIADVLKANFNPNLHLNETNPDANIKTLVDKTDLIVNSTEFCFTPMGNFEIGSEGMILKGDKVIAQSKIETIVKLFDAVRYTNEKQFLNGILVENNTTTNNGRVLEIGPEPAIVDATSASQNEWGGYIALSTVNELESFSPSLPQPTFYSHFSTNFNANYSASGSTGNITTYNVADGTELGVKGPYTYNLNNRLARSFRKESEITTLRAPCDLRIDGAYVERHAGLVYNATAVFSNPGMLSYWIKPSFYPETTGKPRTFFSLTKPSLKLAATGDAYDDLTFFANIFFPAHLTKSKLDKGENPSATYGSIDYRSTTLLFGYSTPYISDDGGIGHISPILNHLSHLDPATGDPLSCHPSGSSPKTNYLRSGQWIHVGCIWKTPATQADIDKYKSSSDEYCQIWINGIKHVNSSVIPNHPHTKSVLPIMQSNFRIGEITHGTSSTAGDWVRNWTCDSTVDEFYIFSGSDNTVITKMYERGRYCPSSETSYISGTLTLAQKNIPSYSTINSPSTFGVESAVSQPKAKILGIAWTYYGEYSDASGNAMIKNYKKWETIADPVPLAVKLNISILKNYDPPTNTSQAEYSPVDQQDGYGSLDIEMDPASQYRYMVKFNIENLDPLNTVLLSSPIFDDVTIYYTSAGGGGVKFMSYSYLVPF